MAIVAVDVVGFSRLMATDEEETLAAWMELRRSIDPIFERGGCRIIKSTGDGVLIDAPSVIEGVRAAITTQEITTAWNQLRPPGRELCLRIGVNLGDVIVEDDGDIYGDGVNLAARLEGLADPGGICLSDAAYQQVRGRIDATFRDRGDVQVKNMPSPVRVWAHEATEGQQLEAERIFPSGVDPGGRRVAPRSAVVALGAIGVFVAVTLLVVDASGNGESGPETTVAMTNTSGVTSVAPVEIPLTSADSLWNVDLGANVAELVVSADSVFVALENGKVEALRLSDGSRRWAAPVDVGRVEGLTVGAGRVMFIRTGTKLVYAFDESTGRQVWRRLVPFDSTVGGPLLAVSADSAFVALGLGVAAFDARSGATLWDHQVISRLVAQHLAAAGERVALTDGRWVYLVDARTGVVEGEVGPPDLTEPRWVAIAQRERQSGFGTSFVSRVLVVTAAQDLLSLDALAGEVLWRLSVMGTPVVVGDSAVFLTVDGELRAVDIESGDVIWTNTGLRPTSPPMMVDGMVFAIDGSDLVLVNPRSGTEIDRIDLGRVPALAAAVARSTFVAASGSEVTAIGIAP